MGTGLKPDKKIKAVLFDFGQTLADSADGFRAAEKQAQEKIFKSLALTEWEEFVRPNGCVLSADGSKLYFTSGSPEVTVYDVNGDGTLSNKRPFAQLNILDTKQFWGGDGMTIDREGNLYVANPHFGIQVFDKQGVSIGIIELPSTTSNCIFGGNDLSTLFVTTFGQKVFSVQTKMKGYQYPIS